MIGWLHPDQSYGFSWFLLQYITKDKETSAHVNVLQAAWLVQYNGIELLSQSKTKFS
jgi:hypothetical protein